MTKFEQILTEEIKKQNEACKKFEKDYPNYFKGEPVKLPIGRFPRIVKNAF